jgi:UDP-N-acetylglucosamine diphosphorylase / glucose-1-phosphate thymidylyltransferase / UDP-N-acetylgalactosamine diphosphorylase / glucosamine-1-phosphate N-acetyltransferase / galactosamine-1-phosphate N-acetyltransferase
MKCVILAAGKSERMRPLTGTIPKPLLKVANKPILEYNLEHLGKFVDEVIIVVGYKKEMIMDFFGESFNGLKLTFVEQLEQKGTGHALLQVKDLLDGKFIVLNGDCIYSEKDIESCVVYNYAILGAPVKNPEHYGVLNHKDGLLIGIDEKPESPKSHLINAGLYVFDEAIFDVLSSLKVSERGEIELTDAVVALTIGHNVGCIESKDYWLTLTFPWDLLDANEFFLKRLLGDKDEEGKQQILGTVEKNATIKGPVFIGENTVVKAGSYIEGPVMIGENCVIGPNCYIRSYTTLDDNSKIGNAVEVKNSIFGNKAIVGHLSYVGDSILGNNVNFGAGTKVANLKHDNKHVFSLIKGELVDSGRRKLGTIVGDGVHTGINTSIYPGRKLFTDVETKPGQIIENDVGK